MQSLICTLLQEDKIPTQTMVVISLIVGFHVLSHSATELTTQIMPFFSAATRLHLTLLALAIFVEWQNTGYSMRNYSSFGFPTASEEYVLSEEQRRKLREEACWDGERGLEWRMGSVYANREYDGEATDSINITC